MLFPCSLLRQRLAAAKANSCLTVRQFSHNGKINARLVSERKRHSWQGWEFLARLEQPGSTVIAARATDTAGQTQPDLPEWNRLGYGNNAIQKIRVDVR